MAQQLFRLSSFWNKTSPEQIAMNDTLESDFPDPCTTSGRFIDEYVDDAGDRRIGVTGSVTDDEEYLHDLPQHWFSWRKLWMFTGPGFLMSIAYLDPGNLEGDLQAGVHTGYDLMWVLMWSTAVGFVLQMLSAKLGVATGMHLAQHSRLEYPPLPRYALWIMTEVAIIGSDIQEVIGSAIAIRLLTDGVVPLWAGVLVTATDSFFILLIERLGVRHLEAVFGGLILTMAVSFGLMYVWAGVPTIRVVQGLLVPRMPHQDLTYATAIVGAIIMPHNIFLHSALVQSRKINSAHSGRKKEAVAYYAIESGLALFVSLLINICVISVFAKGFYGKMQDDIGLENAGDYLGRTFGRPMKYIWAIGLLAAGQSSTMTGTYAGQFVMTGFLDLRISVWARITLTRLIAITPTLIVAVVYRHSEGNQLDSLTQWLNVLNSIQLPFALVPVLTFTMSRRVMGDTFRNSMPVTLLAWSAAFVIMGINMASIYDFAHHLLPDNMAVYCAVAVFVTLYLGFIAYLAVGNQRAQSWFRRLLQSNDADEESEQQQSLLDTPRPSLDINRRS